MPGTNARRLFGMKTRIACRHAEGIVKSADYAFGSNPPYALHRGRQAGRATVFRSRNARRRETPAALRQAMRMRGSIMMVSADRHEAPRAPTSQSFSPPAPPSSPRKRGTSTHQRLRLLDPRFRGDDGCDSCTQANYLYHPIRSAITPKSFAAISQSP